MMMAAVLIFYGEPYDPLWWWVMAAVLLAACVLPFGLVLAIEWVVKGYREEDSG